LFSWIASWSVNGLDGGGFHQKKIVTRENSTATISVRLFLRVSPSGSPSISLLLGRFRGARYSFSQLHRALALGELDALTAADGFVIRLHFLSNLPETLRALQHHHL
jgi:hypothetical protein